jgi:hypothetical protein
VNPVRSFKLAWLSYRVAGFTGITAMPQPVEPRITIMMVRFQNKVWRNHGADQGG